MPADPSFPTDPFALPPPVVPPRPTTAGLDRFVLGAEIARGGMGEVYAAHDQRLGRDVAVKVLQERLAGTGSERRFRAEAAITGRLQHPGIPPVYDLGTLPDGRPFLAMKLIEGAHWMPCSGGIGPGGHWLTVFEGIAQAVAYAHSRGVIHRDLKPQNVMVGAFGEVQVMDWGLAKQTGAGEDEAVVPLPSPDPGDLTRDGSVIGTPAYMAPEQARGEVHRMDARTDVFGLGAVLCALLTGSPPYAGGDALSTHQLAVQAELGDAFARLDGCGADPDLIALCRRCLAADPADRPADAGAVAAEVGRLRQAADDRARRAEVDRARAVEGQRRRKVQARLLGLAAAVFAAGAGVSGWFAWRATRAEREATAQKSKAEDAAADTEAFGEFLVENFLEAARPAGQSGGAGVDVKVIDLLPRAEADIDRMFAGRPAAEAKARAAIGQTWHALDKAEPAERNLRRAVALFEQTRGPAHKETLLAVNSLANLLADTHRLDEAETLSRRAVAGFEAVLGPTHKDTLTAIDNLGVQLRNRDKLDEAEVLLRRAREGREATLGSTHQDTLRSLANLGGFYFSLKRYDKAVEVLSEAYRRQNVALPADHPDTLNTAGNLGANLLKVGRAADAVPLLERAYAGRAIDPSLVWTSDRLVAAYGAAGRPADAVRLTGELVAVARKQYKLGSNELSDELFEVAEALLPAAPAAAEPLLREAAGIRAANKPKSWRVPDDQSVLGQALLAQKKYAEAEPLLVAGYEGLVAAGERVPRGFRGRVTTAGERVVKLYTDWGKPDKAAEWRAKLAAK